MTIHEYLKTFKIQFPPSFLKCTADDTRNARYKFPFPFENQETLNKVNKCWIKSKHILLISVQSFCVCIS